jgi:hypothetical protein
MDLIGNSSASVQTRQAILNKISPILISGPSGVGKYSYVRDLVETLGQVYELDVDRGVDSCRELKATLATKNLSDNLYVVIRDSHSFSMNAQDALLKTFEEINGKKVVIIMISDDDSKILDTLMSRMRVIIRWKNLEMNELLKVFDGKTSLLSTGSYARALLINASQSYKEFYDFLTSPEFCSQYLYTKHLGLLAAKDNNEHHRIILSEIFRMASRCSPKAQMFMRIAKTIVEVPSINLFNVYSSFAILDSE